MGNKAVQAQASNQKGDRLTVHAQETDSPILPVAQLKELHEFRPDIVDFIVKQTELEAEHRRKNETRFNIFVFIERVLGQLCSILIAVMGIGGGIYAGLHGEPTLGGVIVTATVGTLAVAFLRKSKPDNGPDKSAKK